jgi:hypothetical protein
MSLDTSSKDIQNVLFARIKLRLNKDESFVDVISELFNSSKDSAYRRIRGETLLNIDELRILSLEYKISLDELLLGVTNGMFFNYKSVRRSGLDFNVYFKEMAETMERLSTAPNAHMLYAAWDVPIFHYFNFPEVMLFKTYFWRKSVWDDPALRDTDFRLNELMAVHGEVIKKEGQRILDAYIKTPATEIWHDWTLESTLKQIEFGVDSGFFVKKEDYMVLFEQLYQLIEHVEDQAKAGFKFKYGQKPEKSTDNYELYLNEIFFLNNTIIAEADNMREVFVIHESVNYLTTTNPQFCEETADWMQVQKKKSILLTHSSERERNKFFKKQYDKIEKMMRRVMD